MLNTAVLTGERVLLPIKTLAVEADGSLHDVTNFTSCSSAQEAGLKVGQTGGHGKDIIVSASQI